MIRATTNGVLKSYKANLMKSSYNLNKARNTVLTERNFNSYAEDPASATMAFKLRRSWLRTESQLSSNQAVVNKHDTAYTALEQLSNTLYSTDKDVSTALGSSTESGSDPVGSGRAPLGQQFLSTAKAMLQTMNAKYGDNFIFAGADGLNVPFTMDDDGDVCYRGLKVNDPANFATLEALTKEATYVDLGLGLQEDNTGALIESSAFDSSLCGLDFLGFGMDEDAPTLPNNLISVVKEMGDILSRCDAGSGAWSTDPAHPDDEERFRKLQGKLKDGIDHLTEARTAQSSSVTFLKSNQEQLEDTAYNLNVQLHSIEKCDLADAITAFSWAQYCYNAALKVGNSILSQSLIDYMN